MGATKSFENTPNAPKFISPNCLPKLKSLELRWKKASLSVGRTWDTLKFLSVSYDHTKENLTFHWSFKLGPEMNKAAQKSDNLQYNMLGRWDEWLIDQASDVTSTARSIEIVPRGGPPFLGWWLMNSRGGPPFWGCRFMKSRGGPPSGW